MKESRRGLLAGAAAALGVAAASVTATVTFGKSKPKPSPKPTPKPKPDGPDRPNVVLIVTDDMRATDWQALPKTKAALSGGTEFPNFYLQFPVCSPSRTTLLTGLLAHNHGVLLNTGPSNLAGYSAFTRNGMERRSLPVIMQKAGYYTGLIGKFMHGYDESSQQPMGWSRWVARATGGYVNFSLRVDSELIRYNNGEYSTDVLAGFANEFVATAPEDKPFFLFFTPTGPHEPYEVAPRFTSRYTRNIVTRDQSFNEADTSDKPTNIASLPLLTQEQIDQIDQVERYRLQLLAATDEAISGLVKSLRDAGRLNNTNIMVMSDNGYLMGHHRLFGTKSQPYDQAIRVPMLAWGPAFRGGIDKRTVVNCDIAPTIAELGGARLKRSDGASLMTRVRRDYVLLQIAAGEARDGGFGLRSSQLMYFEYDSGDREFYDLRADPLELFNLLPPGGPPDPFTPIDLPTPAELSVKLAAMRRCRGAGCVSVSR